MNDPHRSLLRRLAPVAAILAAGFVLLQCAHPPIPKPPVTAELAAPPDVQRVLRNSCYSCHSNETQLSWFDQVAPAYWLVRHDVLTARQHLNFSEIAKLPAAQQRGMLFEGINQIQLGAMPLPQFLALHPQAKVTPADLAVLRDYLTSATPPLTTETADPTADAQYAKWTQSTPLPDVAPELNGVPFHPEYKTWKPISATDRWDNHTMRAILGNDVAIHAIEHQQTQPWPDGTMFAKVAWAQRPGDNGTIVPGNFIQVELMIRDSQKYKSSKGWGWGRWRGVDFKPYGKDASFDKECVSCHEPVRNRDYVYTLPIGGPR